MSFLSQLRQNLIASNAFLEDEIPPVYVLSEPVDKEELKEAASEVMKEESKPKAKKEKADKPNVVGKASDLSEISKLRRANRGLLVLCITLLLCVIGMFYVNSTINSPTILNYEEELLNKYSSWEQELTEREAAVKEKELKQQ